MSGAGRIRNGVSGVPHQAASGGTGLRIGLVLLASAVYFGTTRVTGELFPFLGHFPRFAQAFLEGRLTIDVPVVPNERVEELIPTSRRDALYLGYPPLPAILLVPFVAVFGSSVTVATACRAVSVLNVLLFDSCLTRMPKLLGLPSIDSSSRWVLNLLFAFGTVTWHSAQLGGDWHLAHAITLAAGLAAIREYLDKNRAQVVGGWIAAIILTRPPAALIGLFFLLPIARMRAVGRLLQFAALPLAAIVSLGVYNAARFGDPTDFGYSRMLLTGNGKTLMAAYGQFHTQFVPRNLFWFFLAPPWGPAENGLPIGFDPRGLSLFIACPALLYALPAIWRRWSQVWVRDALVALVATLVPLLFYFNTGYWQLGHRFSMDYLALLMVLVVAGMGLPPSRAAVGMVMISVTIQAVGILAQPVTRLPPWLVP